MVKKYIKNTNVSIMLFLILSLMFIIPLNISNIYASDPISREQARSDCSFVPPVNVKDSFILSVVTLCIPGILEQIQEKRQIECDYIVCSYEAVKAGLSPTFCQKEKAFRTCKDFVGEAFAIPPLSILNYLREFVANIIANPIGVAWGATASLVRKAATACLPNCSSLIMGPGMIFLAITDITAAIQTFTQMFENGFFPDFSTTNSCEEVEDIKEELEKIVKK
ncbi:MAG: hypothetical protein ACOC16_02550 [Nanoarchaeota archaeon]